MADLADSDDIRAEHLSEAINYQHAGPQLLATVGRCPVFSFQKPVLRNPEPTTNTALSPNLPPRLFSAAFG
ncbi:MAG: hypothetical protein R3C49_06140 [Planctomycetaceae bacterium]